MRKIVLSAAVLATSFVVVPVSSPQGNRDPRHRFDRGGTRPTPSPGGGGSTQGQVRSLDGSGNNQNHSDWGQAGTIALM